MGTTSGNWLWLRGLVAALSIGCAHPAASAGEPPKPQTIKITAKKFEYTPDKIVLHKGVAVTLELTSLDRKHGFAAPELGIRADVKPNETIKVRVVPDKVGTFAFHCDVFCGDGHEGMSGTIVVEP
jgi:cytochrome c oxidase subunit 2